MQKKGPFLALLVSALIILAGTRMVLQRMTVDPAVKVAREVQKHVKPENFNPKKLVPLTMFMLQVKTDPPFRKVGKMDENLAMKIEPGAGTQIQILGLDPDFQNDLPGGFEHRRIRADIFQYVGDRWYPGFVDVVRKKGSQEKWKVLLQCVSGFAVLDPKTGLSYDPLSTDCYWSHFHHDERWHTEKPGSFRRSGETP